MYKVHSTSMVDASRSHYPTNSPFLKKPLPYRNVLSLAQITRADNYLVEYIIGRDFERFHGNPPIWEGAHIHTFRVEVTVSTLIRPKDLYGLDMIEAEKHLQSLCDRIPRHVNEMPQCPTGTTEDLCAYFLKNFSLPDNLIVIRQVMVSENEDRKTVLFPVPQFRGAQ